MNIKRLVISIALGTLGFSTLLLAVGLHLVYRQIEQPEARIAWLQERMADSAQTLEVGVLNGDWGDWGVRLEAEEIAVSGGSNVLWNATADRFVLSFNVLDWLVGGSASLLRIEGLKVNLRITGQTANPVDWQQVRQLITRWAMHSGSIENAIVTAQTPDGKWVTVENIGLSWRQDDGDLHMRLRGEQRRGETTGKLLFYARNKDDKIYWRLNMDDVGFAQTLAPMRITLSTGMQIEGEWDDRGIRFHGALQASDFSWNNSKTQARLHLQTPDIPFYGKHTDLGWLFGVDMQRTLFNGQELNIGHFWATWRNSVLYLQLDSLDIEGSVLGLAESQLLSPRISAGLRQVGLKGTFTPLAVRWDPTKNIRDLGLSARFENLSLSSWNSVPEVGLLNGHFGGTLSNGLVFAESDELTLGMPRLFPGLWVMPNIEAVVGWHWAGDVMRFLSDPICMDYAPGSACVKMGLRLPLKNPLDVQMSVLAGIFNAYGQYMDEFLPSTPDTVKVSQWLRANIRADTVRGGLIFEGLPTAIHPDEYRILKLILDVNNAEARLFEQDNLVHNLHGQLRVILNQGVEFVMHRGMFSDIELNNGTLFIDMSKGGNRARMEIESDLAADAKVLARAVSKLPLDPATSQLFSRSIELQGPVEASARISWLLASGAETLDLDVDMQLKGVDLGFWQSDFKMQGLRGPLHYDNKTFLSSPEIRGTMFEGPVALKLTALREGASNIDLSGSFKFKDVLRYLEFPEMLIQNTTGVTDYSGGLLLDSKSQAALALQATLQMNKLGSSLPPALNFSGSTVPLVLNAQIGVSGSQAPTRYDVSLAGRLNARVETKGPKWSGMLILGEYAPDAVEYPDVLPDALYIGGRIPDMQPLKWWDMLRGNNTIGEGGIPLTLDLLAQDAEVFGIKLERLRVQLKSGETLYFSSRFTEGTVGFVEDDLQVDFNHVIWQSQWLKQAEFPEDGLFGGTQLNLQVNLNRVDIMGLAEPISTRVEVALQPEHYRLQFYDLDALGFYTLENAYIGYNFNDEKSELKGEISNDSLQDVLPDNEVVERLGSAGFGINMNWNGSLLELPERLDSGGIYGDIDINIENGAIKVGRGNVLLFRLASLVNIGSALKRALMLDFRWLFDRGIQFDSLQGKARLSPGEIVLLDSGIKIQTSAGETHITGRILGEQGAWPNKLDLVGNVVLPVGTSASWALAAIGNWPMAVASLVVRKKINEASGIYFHVGGTLEEPDVRRITSTIKPGGESEEGKETDDVGEGSEQDPGGQSRVSPNAFEGER